MPRSERASSLEPKHTDPSCQVIGHGVSIHRALSCKHMAPKLAEVAGVRAALALFDDAYATRLTRPGRTVEHPLAVAASLLDAGRQAPVIVAGLLHDVLEDTDVTREELSARVGNEVAGLVAALTQDTAIPRYRDRKAALRDQVVAAGPDAADISLADKLAKLRPREEPPRRRKMQHYRATLDLVESRYGESDLSRLLRAELDRLDRRS